MTHFPIVVILGGKVETENVEEAITPILEPYDENGEWGRENSRWDWWMIGGRWDGAIGPWEKSKCDVCEGTGTAKPERSDMPADLQKMMYGGCEGCGGSGTAIEVQPGANIVPLSEINEEFKPTAIVTKDGWFEQARSGMFGMTYEKDEQGNEPKSEEEWDAVVKAIYEQHPEGTAVLVDCHV